MTPPSRPVDPDLLPDGLLVADRSGVVTTVNAAASELLARPADALLGRPVETVLDLIGARGPGGAPAFPHGLAGFEGERELTVRRGDGTDVHVSATRRATDDQVAIALRSSGERSGIAVISTVSHELRSPLTSVKGYTSLMLNRWGRLADEQKKMMLEQVHHDADRVTRLVTELLDISRLETGRLVLRRQLVDLPGLAASVVEKVALVTPELDCSLDFPEGLPRVYADPDKVEQVLTNLVENAAKYASPTGMRVAAALEGEIVAVSVSDSGEGIPDDDLPRVFSKFFRRDHGRPSGTGLGLWISRGLVEAHGGELTATSQVGVGSTFRFTLPVDAWEHEQEG